MTEYIKDGGKMPLGNNTDVSKSTMHRLVVRAEDTHGGGLPGSHDDA